MQWATAVLVPDFLEHDHILQEEKRAAGVFCGTGVPFDFWKQVAKVFQFYTLVKVQLHV